MGLHRERAPRSVRGKKLNQLLGVSESGFHAVLVTHIAGVHFGGHVLLHTGHLHFHFSGADGAKQLALQHSEAFVLPLSSARMLRHLTALHAARSALFGAASLAGVLLQHSCSILFCLLGTCASTSLAKEPIESFLSSSSCGLVRGEDLSVERLRHDIVVINAALLGVNVAGVRNF